MSSDIDAAKDYDLQRVLDTHRFGGAMLRDKARAVLEDWLPALYKRMVESDVSTSSLIEIGKVLMELGDMKPKNNVVAQGPTGPVMTIAINLPATATTSPQVIEAQFTTKADNVIPDPTDPTPLDVSALPPAAMRYTFNMNSELTYDDPDA